MAILGLNAFHADASVALVSAGRLVSAIEEERLNRKKHCAGFPALSAKAVLEQAGIGLAELEHVAISRDPRARLGHKILFAIHRPGLGKQFWNRLANFGKVRSAAVQLRDALGAGPGFEPRFHAVGHHRAHAASAFFVSPFEEAACLSIDGFGDFVSAMRAVGRDRSLRIVDEVGFPHSLGLFYTAVTQFLGFHKYGEEWKMMGLAPYGKPRFVDRLRNLIRPTPGGMFELDTSYFRHFSEGIEMSWEDSPVLGRVWSDKVVQLLGPARAPENPDFFGKWADIAASAQVVFEEIYFHVLNDLYERTKLPRLALAGGCALNSAANGKILERTPFKEVFVQPAAGDDGTSIGAAFWVEHVILGRPRRFVMEHAYTGPAFDDAVVEAAIVKARQSPAWDAALRVERLADSDLFPRVASAVAAGKVVGWFQGGMEYGPRALGNRSIVADPRRADMKDILNTRIKHRETYRPFAPSVLEERVGKYFERTEPSPFMLMVYKVRAEQRGNVPAITHVDDTGRLQTVSVRANPRYHALISEFEQQTGVGMVLNTSFNEHEPVVATPEDALSCYLRTRMDVLALGNWVVTRG
jgi:carbamoyltransferase